MSRRSSRVGNGGQKYAQVVNHIYFGNELLNKFINMTMYDGKKSIAMKHVNYALSALVPEFFPNIENEEEAMIEVLKLALENVQSDLEVRSRRLGGATYQVPVALKDSRRIYLAFRWIILAARDRSVKELDPNDYNKNNKFANGDIGRKGFAMKLLTELRAACKGVGNAVEKSKSIKKIADENKHFSHYRF
ncbi:MAG: 30S ribosomal protein S7 [Anaplasmataceae bacterium]|nr:30S ribosomal protein S7 [Anaplasmataceae bacterium]